MNLTEEQLKSVEDFAYRLILPAMIAINLEVDEYSFMEAIRTVGSPVRNAYYRGYLKQLVETREALIKAARNGSNPAQLELLKFINETQRHLNYEKESTRQTWYRCAHRAGL